jgi:hypothetical protein
LNRNDAQYEANKLLPDGDPNKECIHGYLVFDFFTADAQGNAQARVVSDGSYHVLWCGASNADLYSYDTSAIAGAKCNPAKLCAPDDVVPETERPLFTGLPEAAYNVKLALTEESFHQNCGSWATVLSSDVSFEIAKKKGKGPKDK